MHRGGIQECADWPMFEAAVRKNFGADPGRLLKLGTTMKTLGHMISECTHCQKRAEFWETDLGAQIAAIPKFTNFIDKH